eukprot:3187043-Ditylum_brightwellii.AAC.1
MRDNDDSSVPNNGSPSPGKTALSGNPVEPVAGLHHKKKCKRNFVTQSQQLLKILTLTWCVQKQ